MRIILAGIAGGLLLFFWGAFSHTVLPLGEVGVDAIQNEDAVMSAMRANIKEPGLYFYPGIGAAHSADPAEQAAWEAKYKAGPHGILIYHPTGGEVMPASMLVTELISNILACMLAAFVISMTVSSFGGRLIASALFGLVAWLSVDISYWNWYGFPTDYVMAQAADQLVGWFLAGIPIAFLVKGRSQ